MILGWIDEAMSSGARREPVCAVLGLSARTIERWESAGGGEDGREGPHTFPANALSAAERAHVLTTVNSPAYRDQSPKTIVPALADTGIYVGSEATIYRILRAEGQLAHRGRAAAPIHREVPAHVATGPNQVWSWDITYLPTVVRGIFLYLYLVIDIWSRKIMGWAVHPEESMAHAAVFIAVAYKGAEVDPTNVLVLHADNGGPMKGSTMLATLQRLGMVPSFSRPRVSDDNPFSEALFRTMKYSPSYPRRPFETEVQARSWMGGFVPWYNTEHLHSGIQFVTPDDRHNGRDVAILKARHALYEQARMQHPQRWSKETRDWARQEEVFLNAHQARVDAAGAQRSTSPDAAGNDKVNRRTAEVGGRSPERTQDAHRGVSTSLPPPRSPRRKEVPSR
jgi:transposase InsO family protein